MKKSGIKVISRSDFLKFTGLAIGGVTAGHYLFPELMAVPQDVLDEAGKGPGVETWVNTVCGQCPGGCGLTVRRIDGIPVHIKGNPIYPVNRGGVCPMAHSSMEVLFNPDRVKSPRQRTGIRGRGQWEEIDWDPALAALAQRLHALMAQGATHKIAMINGDSSPLLRALCRHWMQAVGSPNYFEADSLRENVIAAQLSQGRAEAPIYDLANSKYILNFGSNMLEEGPAPIYYQQIYGHLRTEGLETRATLVHIDSRINLTASNSDRWIPIRPGTYDVLALGIAYVLIINRLVDEAFIQNHTFGFKSFQDDQGHQHIGFESFIRANYYPEKVSELTGVPTETIISLGEEFGTRRPAIAIADDASRYATNGGFTQWAVYCLNALVGNLQKKGGVFFSSPPPELAFPQMHPASKARASLAQPMVGSQAGPSAPFGQVTIDRFAQAIASGEADQIDTLIVIDANPVFHSTQSEIVVQALHKIKHVVYLGQFIDETAQYGDLILPVHSYLEQTDVSGPMPGLFFNHVGLRQPVIEPLFDTRQPGDVLLDMGRTLLGPDAFPWKDYPALVRKRFEVLYDSAEGSIISESSDAEWLTYLRERGWKPLQYETFTSFEQLLTRNGGWWNPADPSVDPSNIYRTESGKFEFVSSELQRRLTEKSKDVAGDSPREKEDRLLSRLRISARGDNLFMPHHEDPITQGKTEEFPLILTTSQLLTNREGKGASQPSMMEMVGIQVGRYWSSWIEIHPRTAQEYRLKDRELAWVESTRGRLQASVRLFQGIRPGVVHLHLGLGHTSYGQYGTGIGVNATALMENNFDSLSGTPALNGTRVKVSRVTLGV